MTPHDVSVAYPTVCTIGPIVTAAEERVPSHSVAWSGALASAVQFHPKLRPARFRAHGNRTWSTVAVAFNGAL